MVHLVGDAGPELDACVTLVDLEFFDKRLGKCATGRPHPRMACASVPDDEVVGKVHVRKRSLELLHSLFGRLELVLSPLVECPPIR